MKKFKEKQNICSLKYLPQDTYQLQSKSSNFIKVDVTSKKAYWRPVPLDKMQWQGHITSVVLLPKMHNWANHEKAPDKPKLRDMPPNNWPAFFKSVKFMKDKEGLKNY